MHSPDEGLVAAFDTWRSEDGVAAPVPYSVQSSALADETVELIPYGAAKLRVTAFPQLKSAAPAWNAKHKANPPAKDDFIRIY